MVIHVGHVLQDNTKGLYSVLPDFTITINNDAERLDCGG